MRVAFRFLRGRRGCNRAKKTQDPVAAYRPAAPVATGAARSVILPSPGPSCATLCDGRAIPARGLDQRQNGAADGLRQGRGPRRQGPRAYLACVPQGKILPSLVADDVAAKIPATGSTVAASPART